jgi:hypothetical protein
MRFLPAPRTLSRCHPERAYFAQRGISSLACSLPIVILTKRNRSEASDSRGRTYVFRCEAKKRSQRRAFNFSLYFQNSKFAQGFRHISELYIQTGISDLGEILRFWGLDKIFEKRRRNESK